jgi:HEAT repeat protein
MEGFERWEFWWEYNKEPYLQLKSKIHSKQEMSGSSAFFLGKGDKNEASTTSAPTPAQIKQKVIPAFRKFLSHNHYEMRSTAALALGKVGEREETESIIKLLGDQHKQVRESAALALGILGEPEAVPYLIHVMKDDTEGHKITKRGKIFARTRGFAALSLGLIRDESAIEPLIKMIDSKESHRDVPICSIVALGLMKAKTAVPKLINLVENPKADDFKRAYAANTLGQIGDTAAIPTLLKAANDKNMHVRNSSIISLGLLTKDGDPLAKRVISTLSNTVKKGKDPQGKNWALISLAKVGGPRARTVLLETLKRGQRSTQAFAALGLAIYNQEKEKDETILSELRKTFKKVKDSSVKAGLAISLGLIKDKDSAGALRDIVVKGKNPSTRGYAALALGMMNQKETIPEIQKVVKKEKRKADLLRQASIGLGLMGDKTAVPLLLELLEEASSDFLRGSITMAIGYIGDRQAIDPLIELMNTEKSQILTRAFAGVALGIIGESEPIPVLSKISTDINYRTQIDSIREVLDIL